MFTQRPDGTWPPWLAILKIGKVSFQIIWITPTLFGYLASLELSSPRHLGWFIIALVGTMVFEGINCIHNELVDQEEDRANQPNRASLVSSVGESALWNIVLGGYTLCFLGLIPIAIFVSPVVATIMLLGGLAAPIYNWGPRLKRRPGFAQMAIGWAAFCAYLYGWAWNGLPVKTVPSPIWVLTYFFFITSFIKDLPDVRGDEQVNAPGVFSIRVSSIRIATLLFIYLSPYVLIISLIIAGVLPPRFLALCLLVILGIALLRLGKRADTLDTMIVVYELAFSYVHLFFLSLFVLFTPTIRALGMAAILFGLRTVSLYLGLAPRFVEPDFSWSRSLATLREKVLC